jgi:phosphate transport system permease protein
MTVRTFKQTLWLTLIRLAILISILFLLVFLILIFVRGGKVLSLSFLTEAPKDGMTKGGIFPAIIGTFYLTIGSILFALPLGVLAAIYLSEYAKPSFFVSTIRTAINTLAGVPSIVFGLFGLALFVNIFGFGVSILSGSLTLGILVLPTIINASEEAIKTVPLDFREAAYALGATKRQTIMKVVLPTALPSILTGAIISVGRAAGETAPILFTAATFYTRKLPKSILDEVMALPYHIYALMTEGTAPKFQVPIAYGTAVVLLLLVLSINLVAIIIRYRIRRKKKW